MRTNILLLILACIISAAFAVVIVPPLVYFLTLSLSAFLSNAIVSLLVFGALKGLTMRKYFGKSTYEIARGFLSASGTALIAISCMLASAIIVYPLDVPGAAVSALLAGVLFLAVKFISIFAEFHLSEPKKRRSITTAILLTAAFIMLATGVSAMLAIDIQTMGEHYSFEDPRMGLSQYQQAVQEPGISSAVQDMAKEEQKPSALETQVAKTLWFVPKSPGECSITIGNFEISAQASFTCMIDEDGEKRRAFCPISVRHSQIQETGNLAFSATGACADSGIVVVSSRGFERIQ
ncbi:MAG: hypothetical protein ABIF01_05640 [Candidatus Micrarchaeota archaeon]